MGKVMVVLAVGVVYLCLELAALMPLGTSPTKVIIETVRTITK